MSLVNAQNCQPKSLVPVSSSATSIYGFTVEASKISRSLSDFDGVLSVSTPRISFPFCLLITNQVDQTGLNFAQFVAPDFVSEHSLCRCILSGRILVEILRTKYGYNWWPSFFPVAFLVSYLNSFLVRIVQTWICCRFYPVHISIYGCLCLKFIHLAVLADLGDVFAQFLSKIVVLPGNILYPRKSSAFLNAKLCDSVNTIFWFVFVDLNDDGSREMWLCTSQKANFDLCNYCYSIVKIYTMFFPNYCDTISWLVISVSVFWFDQRFMSITIIFLTVQTSSTPSLLFSAAIWGRFAIPLMAYRCFRTNTTKSNVFYLFIFITIFSRILS